MAKLINDISKLIDSCRGRMVLMEALCQAAKLVAGYQIKQCSNVCLENSGEPPVLQYTLDCELNDYEPDRITAVLVVMSNAVDLLFYPVDKLLWLAKHVRKQESWRYVNSLLCMLSVYLNVVRSSRTFSLKGYKLSYLNVLSLARLLVDLVHTICFVTRGNLWSIKHSFLYMIAFGTVSTGLGMCQILTEDS
ncbi:uncharacterized protein LOC122611497 isoform X1 [Drosophila teissieri]|uniref:uncharacterized protein LOC122611497 isoform X1 n=2 Tax=Drosophila teissieri TaxID=7243 RepID=UPI001CB9DFC8|nr:uncharacterized protein LOC122611497 isoform X1 [Drosophila teissieri]